MHSPLGEQEASTESRDGTDSVWTLLPLKRTVHFDAPARLV